MTDATWQHTPLILVVDDDWMNREVMEAHLTGAGYAVEVAHSGDQALEIAFAQPPDLVLLDVRMHGMNGYEVCQQLKQNPLTRFTPVVIVTALESDEDKHKAIDAGADDFMSKPFTSLMMLTRVRSLLRIKHLHDELAARNTLLDRILGPHVSDGAIAAMLANPEQYVPRDSATNPATVLLAAIHGFTTVIDEHPAPDALTLLNRIFQTFADIIARYEGRFDTGIAHDIMAVFDAPDASELDALRAVAAASEIRQTFDQLCQADSRAAVRHLRLSVALASGDIVAGPIGAERSLRFSAMGAAVEAAHQLQQAAGPGEILLSAATYEQVQARVSADRLETAPRHDYAPQVVYRLNSLEIPDV